MKKTRRCRRTFAAVLVIMTVIALFAVVLAALRHRALPKAEPMINEEPERSSCEALDEPQTPQLKCGAGLRNVTSVLFPNLTHCTHTEDDLVSMLLLRDGYFIDCLSTHMTSLAIHFMQKSAACMNKGCIQQRLIVDVGANIGSCTLPMVAQASQWARVVAFEPTRINGRALYYSLAVNGLLPCVTVVESAAWEPDPRSNPLKSSDPDDLEVERRIRRRIIYFERQNLGHAVVLENDGADQIPGVEMEEVLITTFTNEMKKYVLSLRRDDGRGMAPVRLSSLQIPFMKIDTEGTELAVLRGSAPFFAAHQVWIVMIEVNVKVSVVAGFSSAQMLTLLREWGYRLYYVQGSTASGGRGSHVVQDITPFVQSCLDHPKNVFGILPRLVEGYSDDGEASLLTYLNMTESELLSRYRAA